MMRAGVKHTGKVLLVEDEPDIRFLMRKYLEASGYGVVEAANGREGVERALSEHPDVVVMDLSMPIVDGLSAARRIRRDERTWGVPVIAVSANVGRDFRVAAREAGCDEYVTKPLDFDRLDRILSRYCPAGEG